MEFFQILWDLFVLRDATRKGEMNKQLWVFAIGFVILLYAILLPATVLWQNHPQYKPVFIAALVLDAIVFVVGIVWAWKLRAKLIAAKPKRLLIGTQDEVIYSGTATKDDAGALGDAFKSDGYFHDRGVTVLLDKGAGGTSISFVVQEGSWDDPGIIASFETIARCVAPAVGGLPVQLHLVDSQKDIKKSSTVQ